MTTLHLLCAGAAQGLVKALQHGFRADTGTEVQGRFGAVGAMQEALLAGERCDVFVATAAMLDSLSAQGRLRADTCAPLGRVRTGVAVRGGQVRPDVSTPDALQAALLGADAIYLPDPVRSTAGIHFANVMRQLGIFEALQPRLHTHPNGATAMRELAACSARQPIGCTQVTEIVYTEGVDLVGVLPARFELATVYSAAVSASAADPALAARFVALLCGPASHSLRLSGGFEC